MESYGLVAAFAYDLLIRPQEEFAYSAERRKNDVEDVAECRFDMIERDAM